MTILNHHNLWFKALLAIPLVTVTLYLAYTTETKPLPAPITPTAQIYTTGGRLKAHINPITGDFSSADPLVMAEANIDKDTTLTTDRANQALPQLRSSQSSIKVRLGGQNMDAPVKKAAPDLSHGVFNQSNFIRTPDTLKSQLIARIDQKHGLVFSHGHTVNEHLHDHSNHQHPAWPQDKSSTQ